MNRPKKSFEIALSAIACALAAVALTVGAWVDFLLPSGYLFAIFALMLPLSRDFVWGEALALIGAVLLALLCAMPHILLLVPFAVFFGWHPLLNYLQLKFTKKKPLHALWLLLEAALFDGTLLLVWFTLGDVLGFTGSTWYPFFEQYLYYLVFIGGTVLFVVYDVLIFLCQRSVNRIVARIRR